MPKCRANKPHKNKIMAKGETERERSGQVLELFEYYEFI